MLQMLRAKVRAKQRRAQGTASFRHLSAHPGSSRLIPDHPGSNSSRLSHKSQMHSPTEPRKHSLIHYISLRSTGDGKQSTCIALALVKKNRNGNWVKNGQDKHCIYCTICTLHIITPLHQGFSTESVQLLRAPCSLHASRWSGTSPFCKINSAELWWCCLLCSGSGSAVAAELSKSKDYGCAGEVIFILKLST